VSPAVQPFEPCCCITPVRLGDSSQHHASVAALCLLLVENGVDWHAGRQLRSLMEGVCALASTRVYPGWDQSSDMPQHSALTLWIVAVMDDCRPVGTTAVNLHQACVSMDGKEWPCALHCACQAQSSAS
jgi:hypothetical protein